MAFCKGLSLVRLLLPSCDILLMLSGINGQFPCPTIEANVGDTIVVNVVNQLGNETMGIHFHGQK